VLAPNHPASTSLTSAKQPDLNTNGKNAAFLPLFLTAGLCEFLLHHPAKA